MPQISNLQKVFQAIKRLASSTPEAEVAIERARTLPEHIDPKRYSPPSLARAALQKPAAQKGFSQDLSSSRAPFATTLIRPSEWAEHTPPLNSTTDANIIEYLKSALEKDKLKELPFLWINDRPMGLEAGYEGRHRMKAMLDLYGDDPVLVNALRGNKYEPQEQWYPSGYHMEEQVVDQNRLSPLQMIRRDIEFGDKPYRLEPLWFGE